MNKTIKERYNEVRVGIITTSDPMYWDIIVLEDITIEFPDSYELAITNKNVALHDLYFYFRDTAIKKIAFSKVKDKHPDITYDRLSLISCKPCIGKSDDSIIATKQLRGDIDDIIQEVKKLGNFRETNIAVTKLQEAVMWLGMNLKRLRDENPYPSSKDPSTGTQIEPTADNLKL